MLAALGVGFASCTDFIANRDLDSEWQVERAGSVVLHYRAPGYSGSASPDSGVVQTILDNQNRYAQEISDTLNLPFSDAVLIYLYNQDEAEAAIGTQGGGHAIPEFLSFYYTYFDRSHLDLWGQPAYIGRHELVHVITHHLLGEPGTKLMSEGYAVALDGGYGIWKTEDGLVAKPIREWMMSYYDQDRILSIDDLLTRDSLPENVYYPNAGYFIRYCFRRFGTQIMNRLFTTPEDSFRTQLEQETGVSVKSLEAGYHSYCVETLS
jgi:hypothetical protein